MGTVPGLRDKPLAAWRLAVPWTRIPAPAGLIPSTLTSAGWCLRRSEHGRGLWFPYPALYLFILNGYRITAWPS